MQSSQVFSKIKPSLDEHQSSILFIITKLIELTRKINRKCFYILNQIQKLNIKLHNSRFEPCCTIRCKVNDCHRIYHIFREFVVFIRIFANYIYMVIYIPCVPLFICWKRFMHHIRYIYLYVPMLLYLYFEIATLYTYIPWCIFRAFSFSDNTLLCWLCASVCSTITSWAVWLDGNWKCLSYISRTINQWKSGYI